METTPGCQEAASFIIGIDKEYGNYFPDYPIIGQPEGAEDSPLSPIRHELLATLQARETSDDVQQGALLVLSEAIANAIKHGDGFIGVAWGEVEGGIFAMNVYDLNINKRELPTAALNNQSVAESAEMEVPEEISEEELLSRLMAKFGESDDDTEDGSLQEALPPNVIDTLPESGRGLTLARQNNYSYRRDPVKVVDESGEERFAMVTTFLLAA